MSPREYKGEIVISFEIEGHDYEDRCGAITNNVPEFNKPKGLVPWESYALIAACVTTETADNQIFGNSGEREYE